jgi:hypothetical protein
VDLYGKHRKMRPQVDLLDAPEEQLSVLTVFGSELLGFDVSVG